MDLQIPAWLTKEFIQKSLEYGKQYKIIIENMKIDKPIPKGANYQTDIYGVKVEYKRSDDLTKQREKAFIIKSPIKGPMYEMMLQTGYIQKESVFYNVVLPKFKSVLGESDVEDDEEIEDADIFLPKSYFSAEENIVVLEDLKTKGYKMMDRQNQLDYNHCVIALKSLAKFHAVAAVVHEKEPDFVEKIGRDIFKYELKDFFSVMVTGSFKLIVNFLKMRPDTEKYSNWFLENSDKSTDNIINEYIGDENEFKVLNHGDFWLANVMFKHNSDEKPIKDVLIDLQLYQYTSPAFDFIYFMEGSVQEKVRDEYFDDLITEYVKELNLNLEKFESSKRLKELEFKDALRRRPYYRVFVNLTNLAGVLADPKETKLFDAKEASVDDFSKVDSSPFLEYYKNEKYMNRLAKRLAEFEKEGIITAANK